MLIQRRYGASRTHSSHFPLTAPIHTFRNYVVHVDDREHVQRQLAEASIATALNYAPPLHRQSAYREISATAGPFPVADRLGETLLALPIGAHLDGPICHRVARVLAAAV